MSHTAWESDLAHFLSDLSAVQTRAIQALVRKRECLVASDAEGLAEVDRDEVEIVASLEGCLERREELLSAAAGEGLPADSIASLASAVKGPERQSLTAQVREAASRSRLLEHHSLVNWVLVQRTLIHLSQLLEIIATGGRLQPTYGKANSPCSHGALVDRAV
jgi:hypothetical protein